VTLKELKALKVRIGFRNSTKLHPCRLCDCSVSEKGVLKCTKFRFVVKDKTGCNQFE